LSALQETGPVQAGEQSSLVPDSILQKL